MPGATPPEPVPQAAPQLRIARFRAEVDAAVRACLSGDSYVGGPFVERFEAALADVLGCAHIVGCNSGTDAISLGLRALGVGQGDEVIVPSLTAAGTLAAVVQTGARPRIADVDPVSRNLDLACVRAAMSERVRAVVAVHLHGNPVDLDPLLDFARARSLFVVEDCAQAIGARYKGACVGTLGDLGAFSFYPTKNLGAVGDGGAVATSDAALAAEVRSIASYGWDARRDCVRDGVNSRLDALQAAILTALLPHLAAGNAERAAAAARYAEALRGTRISAPIHAPGSVYHQYAVEAEDRPALEAHLAAHGIGTGRHYASGLHDQPHLRQYVGPGQGFAATEARAARMVSLPIQPELTARHQDRIVAALRSFEGA